jgi:hypothetical protein
VTTTRPRRRRPPVLPACHFCEISLVHDVVQITVSVFNRPVRICRVCLDGLLFAAELQDADAETDLETMWHAPGRRQGRR